jgi:hypothetical protein
MFSAQWMAPAFGSSWFFLPAPGKRWDSNLILDRL